jgi:uncharacterized protein YhaN
VATTTERLTSRERRLWARERRLTNAEKQSRYRQRQRHKLAAIETLQANFEEFLDVVSDLQKRVAKLEGNGTTRGPKR